MKKSFFLISFCVLFSMTINSSDRELIDAYNDCEIGRVEELLKNPRIDVNQTDSDGTTLLLVACKRKAEWLVNKILERSDVDVNKADNNGETPLLEAVRNNGYNLNIGIIDLLLTRGALNTANNKGETPLGIAKNTQIYGMLEYHFTGQVTASKYCSSLPKSN